MSTLHNEILIDAPVSSVWKVLANLEELEQYDPTVKHSFLQEGPAKGPGAKRKVEMLDGKNWFEEKVLDYKPNESLSYQLTACSFPVDALKHSYTFVETEGKTRVIQSMEYKIKYGFLGKILDQIMIRKQYQKGIKAFFQGLKDHIEKS